MFAYLFVSRSITSGHTIIDLQKSPSPCLISIYSFTVTVFSVLYSLIFKWYYSYRDKRSTFFNRYHFCYFTQDINQIVLTSISFRISFISLRYFISFIYYISSTSYFSRPTLFSSSQYSFTAAFMILYIL